MIFLSDVHDTTFCNTEKITSRYTLNGITKIKCVMLLALGKFRNIDKFVLSTKSIIHRDNFRRNLVSFLTFHDAREEQSDFGDYSNLEVIVRVEVVVTCSFTFHGAISKKNGHRHWRGLASYGFVTIATSSTLSWVNHWWIGDGIVGFGSCDRSLFFCIWYSRAFSLVLDHPRPPSTALPSLFVKPNPSWYICFSNRLCKTQCITIYYVAVYRYPPQYVYIMHTKTPWNRPPQNSHPQCTPVTLYLLQ